MAPMPVVQDRLLVRDRPAKGEHTLQYVPPRAGQLDEWRSIDRAGSPRPRVGTSSELEPVLADVPLDPVSSCRAQEGGPAPGQPR